MSNVYHVLHRRPRLHRRLKGPQEKLARAILASGRLRLDADNSTNFTRLLIPSDRLNLTFTRCELAEPRHVQASLARIMRALQPRHSAEEARRRAQAYLESAQTDLKRRASVSPQTELMAARAIVSCNALPVIRLLHHEGAEIFISFGHSVSDVLDIATWQDVGENNGLQSFGRGQNAVYVSCGGHPFLSDEERSCPTDGFPALARLLIVAAQETGHHGDMIRAPGGGWLGRHSAQDWGRAPSPAAGKARREDAARTARMHDHACRLGLNLIVEWERHLEFYRSHKLRNARSILAWAGSRIGWQIFAMRLRLRGSACLTRLQRSPYPATLLRTCLHDMAFNLAPDHEAYRRSDPAAQEAMLCMEALARVPQQVIKWGHPVTGTCMAGLYRLYYHEVVPACADALAQRNDGKRKTPQNSRRKVRD